MGIYDRDYMRRRPDDSESDIDAEESSAEAKAEALAGRFSKKHSGLFVFVGVTFVLVVILAMLFGPSK